MANSGLSQRLAKFKQNFSQILGPKRQGYSEVGLDQPLVSSHAQSDDEYFQKHGVLRPGSRPPAGDQYQVPGGAYGGPVQGADMAYAASASTAIPDEVLISLIGSVIECSADRLENVMLGSSIGLLTICFEK
jgi:hypothetical protein